MLTEFISILIALCLFYSTAEFIGRAKHIGKWWSFLLLASGLIPGIIALLFSPSAKVSPTRGTPFHTIAGWIFIVLFGAIPLLYTSISIQTYLDYGIDLKYKFGIPISNIISGFYLIQLGKGKIINNNPKIYFPNLIKSIIPLPVKSSFNSDTKTESLYYVIENNIQSEAISFDQLKDKKISEDTLVWRNGLTDWTKAKDLKELHNIILFSPPPIPSVNNSTTFIEEKNHQVNENKILTKDVQTQEDRSYLFIKVFLVLVILIWIITLFCTYFKIQI